MGYVAEVVVTDNDLTERMSRMRAWLDHQKYEPRSFRFHAKDGRQSVHVSFDAESEAAAFVAEFGGALLPSAATEMVIP